MVEITIPIITYPYLRDDHGTDPRSSPQLTAVTVLATFGDVQLFQIWIKTTKLLSLSRGYHEVDEADPVSEATSVIILESKSSLAFWTYYRQATV